MEKRWHCLTASEVLEQLLTSQDGLSEDIALKRLAENGYNRLSLVKGPGIFRRFLSQFHHTLIYVLLASALITAMLGHVTDTLVILTVILVNAIIGLAQEGKAARAMEAIQQIFSPVAAVLREGKRRTVSSETLVAGDVVLLEAGDRVPADLRLVLANGLQVQEAILTGESQPVDKNVEPTSPDAVLAERFCMVFSGTHVTSGQATGVVVATGAATQVGLISARVVNVEKLATPLVMQMNIFARWLTILILVIAAFLLAFGSLAGSYQFSELFMIVVGLSIAAIPEGLPAVLTITMAVGAQAMARRNAAIKQLPAIETIGSVSVICTDKTGTLTRNEMMVADVMTGDGVLTAGNAGEASFADDIANSHRVTDYKSQVLAELARAAALCNDAELREDRGEWKVEGDPMEGALLAFAKQAGCDWQHLRNSWSRIGTIPFDAKLRFMATLCSSRGIDRTCIYVKGAPEKILGMCSFQMSSNGESETFNHELWLERAETIAAKGQRVLALACKNVGRGQTCLAHGDIETGLVFLGIIGLMDPPREEAIKAVAQCYEAGIQVKMITGDHASTALAIGRQIGLRNLLRVLSGSDIDRMDDRQLSAAVMNIDVFARTSPEHKLRLVAALQANDMTVAMTGDGVNDAPALKRADVGIAMGRKGSDLAKEAASLVLLDDNFASIVAAVNEGRRVYDNITKVISWTLPTDAGEACVLIIALLFGMSPLPVSAIQILWINLVTTTILGTVLAFEPAEPATMRRCPRARQAPLLGLELGWHITLVSILFVVGVLAMHQYALNDGYSAARASTVAVNTLVVMEVFHLFFIRNIYGTSLTWQAVKGTRVLWFSVVMIALAQMAITFIPDFQRVFGTEAISAGDGLWIMVTGLIFFSCVEIEKRLRLIAKKIIIRLAQ